MSQSIYDFGVKKIDGTETRLSDYKGKVLLVVNVASKCGLTPQYEGLEGLYQKYREQGLEVLGFPANEFLSQEPGSNAEIQSFCTMNFGVKFPMFEKIVVKGDGKHPLYKFLTSARPEATMKPNGSLLAKLGSMGLLGGKSEEVKWNFEKFLVSRSGDVVGRFSPELDPLDPLIVKEIESQLKN